MKKKSIYVCVMFIQFTILGVLQEGSQICSILMGDPSTKHSALRFEPFAEEHESGAGIFFTEDKRS